MRETGLPISCGLSINKTVSKIATGEAKPNNARAVVRGTEKTFLAPLSVRKIPMVGEKMHHSLRGLGIQHIHTLQHMPPDLLQRVFGQSGLQLWKKANGEDHAPVVPFSERKSISTERTFERDTTDLQKIKGILTAMTENLAFQLRRGGRLCACVAVKIRYSDFQTVSMQKQIAYSSADHVLIPLVGELFQRLYNRRMLIRLVGVRFSDLVSGGVQLRLFEQVPQAHQLYEAMDRMRERFGDRAVVRASGLMARTIGRENPFNGEPPPLLANRRL
jgi:DNA polymerase-4